MCKELHQRRPDACCTLTYPNLALLARPCPPRSFNRLTGVLPLSVVGLANLQEYEVGFNNVSCARPLFLHPLTSFASAVHPVCMEVLLDAHSGCGISHHTT
jgi:hypothetical protein